MSSRVSPQPSLRETLRGFVEFFRSELRGPDAAVMREAQRDEILSRAVVLVWISLIVMPTGIWFFIWKLAPSRFPQAFWIVLAALGAALVHRALVLRGVFDKHYHLAMFLLVAGVFGPTAAGIVVITRGTGVDFLFAFFLIYFAFASLFPADVIWIVGTSAALITSYVGARFYRPQGVVFDAATISALIYLAQLTFICVVLNRVICKLFFAEKRSRHELAKANEGLRELDKVKTSFFSNVSHEIRTPLTLILTPITHILQSRGHGLDSELRDRLEGIRANANRLLKMVNTLLDFAKLEGGEAKVTIATVELPDVAAYVAALFEGTASEKRIGLRIEVANDAAISIRSDLDMLEKILINLVGNALKFTPDGGQISVRCARDGRDVVIAVADTGIGIAPEHQEAIFRRFVQIEGANTAAIRGTGIGLSMVREYCKLLGGSIALQSEFGKGSTFTVRLPIDGPAVLYASTGPTRAASLEPGATLHRSDEQLASEAALATADLVVARDAAAVAERPPFHEGRSHVLVVDDNAALLALASSILRDEYNVHLASSGEDALELIEREPIELVVSDVMMPGISGLELCRKIRVNERTRHLPVILLTARGGTVQKIEGLDQGADDYIGKPFDPDELKARIRSLFELRKTTSSLAQKSEELERALKKLKEEELKIIESEKLRSLGILAAGLFHELHNYMNIITNGAMPVIEAIAKVRKGLPSGTDLGDVDLAEIAELADLIVSASRAASELTGELKGFAHLDKATARRVDVNTTVRSTVRMLGRSNAHLFVMDCSSSPVLVECVPTRLTQVFTNLFKNSIDAMNGKGTITVSTRIDGVVAVATVTDTGTGVAATQVERLFEPFNTTKKQGEGLGLGLSLSRKVLHDIGGDLRYDASYVGGARFVLTMPLARSTSVRPPPREVLDASSGGESAVAG